MKYIYLDAIGGASGDMLLGAFLDGLVPYRVLQESLSQLKLPGYRTNLNDTQRHHIGAKKFEVHSPDHTHRHLADIERLIETAALARYVKENSLAVFRKLGEQEARIHRIPLEKVHFHEVGAVDSIIDIVGTFICLNFLKPDKILTSPLPVSHGFVKAAHGNLPVPAPATLALLGEHPLVSRDIAAELVTPTGAVLFSHISDGQLPADQTYTIQQTGYGAGSKDFAEFPNLLRIWSGELKSAFPRETVLQVETNIDDMNPEFYPHLQQRLFEAGVMDVTIYPGIMKKGRPGNLVSILTDPAKLDTVRDILYRETSTIGFRCFTVQREKLQRELKTMDSPWGELQFKAVIWQDIERWIPEYEQCRKIAGESGQSLPAVYQQVQAFLSAAISARKKQSC